MVAQQMIDNRLEACRSSQPTPENPVAVVFDLDHGLATCSLVAVGELACAAMEIAYQSKSLASLTTEQLRSLADDLASRLKYLLEPIAVLECEDQEPHVQMRSDPPARDQAKRIGYYELNARNQQLLLRRFEKSPDKARHPVAMNLTREVFARLLQDLDEAAP